MEDRILEDIDHFFENQRLQKALSDLGVFAIDYAHHRAFASNLWLACGYDADDMNDVLFLQLIHPEDRGLVEERLNALMEGRTDGFEGVFRMRRSDGAWLWLAATYRVIYRAPDGRPLLYIGHDRDVTTIKEAEQESLRQLEEIETLRQVVADVNSRLDLNDTVDLILQHSRRVIPYDRSTVQILEDGQFKVIGSIGFEDREAVLKVRFDHPNAKNPGTHAVQSRAPMLCNDIVREYPGFRQVAGEAPTRSWLGIPLIADNEVIGLLALDSVERGFYTQRHLEVAQIFAGHVALAIEKARMFDDVRTMALTDLLTGAGNRHALQLQGPFFLEKAKREKRPIDALMIDLDHFKKVNDTWGHDAGDAVLREAAGLIRSCLRNYDLFFRYGGEEFLILLPDTEIETSLEIAERIRSTLELAAGRPSARVTTVSVGLGSLVPTASMTLSDLIKVADLALYEAKNGGRNRVVRRA